MSRAWSVVRTLQAQPFVIVSVLAIAASIAVPKALPVIPPRATIVQDMTGEKIPVQLPASRVVMFPPSLWEYLTVDPDSRHIIGITNYLHREVSSNILSRIHPRVTDIPVVVTRGWNTAVPGDPEDLILRRPDAVLSWGWFSDGLKQAALPVVSVTNILSKPAEEIDLARWRMIASLAGADERFTRILSRYRQRMADAIAAAERAKRLAGGKAPSVMYMDVRKSGLIHAETGSSFFATALTTAGGVNAAQRKQPGTINIEQLISWNPDIIVLSCNGSDSFPSTLFEDLRFSTLSAVRSGKVYKAPCGTSRMQGFVETPLLIDWLSELFYPEVMPKTFREKFSATYKEFFDYTVSNDEIDETLALNANASSNGFRRFAR
jgi:iron complex transport system substrate-binding protein